jgi:phosphinothricin acetyltransferase
VLIRHADPVLDAATCAAIYAPYVRDTVISLEAVAPTEREFSERIERISVGYPWLVAEDRGVLVGYAYASQHRERAAYRWAADVTVYLDAAHHRRGVGRALYTTLFGLLVRQGMHVVCAGVTLPNEASVGLHESLGFTPIGVYHRIGWKFGAWWDVGWWQRALVDSGPDEVPDEPGPPARLEDS